MQRIYRRILTLLHILEHLFIRTPVEGSFCNNKWIVRPSVHAFLKIFRTNLLQNNWTAACELLLLRASQLAIVQIPQWNIRAVCEICYTFTIKAPHGLNYVVLVHILFSYFHCWPWISKCVRIKWEVNT